MAVARPPVLARGLNDLRADGIHVYIAGEPLGVSVRLDEDAFESSLKKVSEAILTLIMICRISRIDKVHDLRQIAAGRLGHKMKMILHKAIGVEAGLVRFARFRKAIQEAQAVQVAEKDCLFSIPPGRDVVECAFIFDPELSCHIERDR